INNLYLNRMISTDLEFSRNNIELKITNKEIVFLLILIEPRNINN
ncbi:10370_t:CDS:1, partial [Gigaspora margarita]